MLLGQKLEGGRRIDPRYGLIMPWYTSPCLEWLINLDLKGKIVFEYGVGDSTEWYRSKMAIRYGVDNDEQWAKATNSYYEPEFETYTTAINKFPRLFDVVINDGVFRDACTEHALKKLKPGGFLIIDNWKQKSADLEHWPLTEKLIEGMPITIYKEPDHEDWATAVITKV